MWSNYHTHTHYCDGKGTVQDYVNAAEEQGVAQIGFSSHAPLPFPCKWCMQAGAFKQYLEEIALARQADHHIEIYAGLEVDYIPGVVSPRDFASQLDYTIGSIHFVDAFEGKYWEIDNTFEIFKEGLERIFEGNLRSALSRYFELTREMIREGVPDILGHMDKIKINALGAGLDESEPWYVSEIDSTLQALKN